MVSRILDEVDRTVLYALQQDARNTTTRSIGERVGVTASTVSNRIARLEAEGTITNYIATLDYERMGFPIHVLIGCSAPVHKRESIARSALDIQGVVHVNELMVGEENIQIEAVGESHDDITNLVTVLSEKGVGITDEILIRNQYYQPLKFLKTEAEE